MKHSKKALLISPVFFDYYKDMTEELNKNGYEVIFFNDRPSEHFFDKALLRLNKKSQVRKVDKYVNSIISSIDGVYLDLVFVVLGQCFSKEQFRKIKEAHPEAEYVYYAWDSSTNFPVILELQEFFDRKYSFDDSDVKKHGFDLLPLFYTNDPVDCKNQYPYSSVLTIKEGKLDGFNRIKSTLPNIILGKGYEYLYIQSKSVFLYYKIKLKEFKGAKLKDFHYRKISRVEYLDITNKSAVVIDCQMKNQIGLTMRTFEALRANKKVVTTNSNIKNYDFYTPDNIFIIDDKTDRIPLDFFQKPFNKKFTLSEKYSLHSFMKTIIGDKKL